MCEDLLKTAMCLSRGSALALKSMARQDRGDEWLPFIFLINRKMKRNEAIIFEYA